MLSGGTVQCWGSGRSGQLGDGSATNSSVPVTVTGITTATGISAGVLHTCARLTGGTLTCWGTNWNGELGNGTTAYSSVLVTVSGVTTATAVSASGPTVINDHKLYGYSCALLTNETVKCWGSNRFGQLGHNPTTNSKVPVTTTGITSASSLGAGAHHTCALLTGGIVTCWGSNWTGELGNGSPGQRYCFSTRARDNTGNTSSWSAERCATVPVDDRSLTRRPTGAWARTAARGWIAGTASTTTTRGARLTTTSVTVKQVGIVAWRCSTCGTVDLYVGTTKAGALSLHKAGAATRSLLTLPRFASPRTGTVSVRVTTCGTTVKVDALALSRT